MDETHVMAKLAALLREVFEDPSLAVTAATSADDVPAWDSMTHITLIVAAEQEFGVHFTASEMDGLANVGELVHLIATKMETTPAH